MRSDGGRFGRIPSITSELILSITSMMQGSSPYTQQYMYLSVIKMKYMYQQFFIELKYLLYSFKKLLLIFLISNYKAAVDSKKN